MKKQIKFMLASSMLLSSLAWAAPPATPSLYISSNGPLVNLYWDEVAGAEKYTILATDKATGTLFGEFDMGDTNRVSVTLPVGTSYFVSVRAENADGVSPYSTARQLVVSPDVGTPTIKEVIQNYASTVIYNTYRDLADRAVMLNNAIIKFRFDKTAGNLAAARQHWVNTRRPWEQSEAFLFGPVDTEGLDPAMDSWPVNAVDLQNLLDSDTVLTAALASGFNDDLKGFHVIEFLLYGIGGNKTNSDFTERELQYLGAIAEVLMNDTERLAQAWSPNGGNFLAKFAQAGSDTSVYDSEKAALQEMIENIIGIADELRRFKLEEPTRTRDATKVESQFSFNSRADFMDNVRAIRNAYTGNYLTSEGPGLNALVKATNPALDTKINEQIEAALVAIDAIPQPFADSILNNPESVQNAIRVVSTLLVTLSNELLPFSE